MKLHTEKQHVEKSGHLVEQEFKIKATAKAFGILSSGLYSDKILAIVRELSCNAWDAHVAANNTGTKFEIKLPTTLDPTFHVKDFGTGLSHDEVMNLYTTYFDSTKSDSNDFIGALGLGSKSPFSYVSQFTVESRYKGMKSLYSAFIGENGVPQITLLGKEKTDLPNGMTVALATKTGDADKFASAARKALMYFNPQPKVYGGGTGFAPHELQHTVHGTNWKVRKSGYYAYMSGAYVVQGFVAYPIDRDILQQSNLPALAYSILGLDIDFTVPLGAVEIAASREALSYTKMTIKNLAAAVDVAASEMRDSIQKEFDACKNLFAARMMYATYDDRNHKMNRIFDELNSAKPFTYKGTKLDDSISLDLTKIKDTQLQICSLPSYGRVLRVRQSGRWAPDNVAKAFSVQLHEGMTVLVDDTFNAGPILVEYLNDRKVPNSTRDVRVLVIKGVSKNSYKQSEIDSILKMLGNPEYALTSGLSYVKAKKAGTTYRARKADEVVVWDGFPENGGYRRNQIRRVYSRLCWKGATVDPQDKSETRLFVELDRFTIVNKGKEFSSFDTFLTAMKAVGIIKSTDKIIGLNEKQVARVKSNKAFISVFDYCAEGFADLNKTGSLAAKAIVHHVMYAIGDGVAKNIVVKWKTIEPQLVDGTFKTTLGKIFDMYEAAKATSLNAQNIESVANYVDPKFSKLVESERVGLVGEFGTTMDKHAMLRLVNWSLLGAKDVDMIVEYVNFVAKS